MALDFPNSPISGQEFSASGKTWRWNGSKWISSTSALQLTTLNDVGDVTITAVSNGQIIKWNGSAWVNAADNTGTTINSIDDITDVTITSAATGQFLKWNGTAWVNDAIDLGTDTTGNYVSGLTQGTGVTVTHTPSEGSSPTIAIGQDVSTSASVTFLKVETTGDVVVGGNLTVNGTTTTLNTETLAVEDNIVVLNSGVTGSPTVNAGIEVERGTSANVDLRWNESTDKWEFTNDGSTYSNLGAGGATISDTPPSSPVTGQIWYESDTGKTFVYYDSFWIEIVGSTGAQGPTGASGSRDLSSGLASGTYYTTSSNTNTSLATTTTTGTVSYLPFFVEQTTTFDRIACRTGSTFTGTSTVRLGIYNNSNKRPTTVLLDAGTVAATATSTIYSITINQTLNPGWYWLAHVVNSTTGTHTFIQVGDALPFGQMPLTATFAFQPNYTQTGVTGAFATASPTTTGNSRILVALRVA